MLNFLRKIRLRLLSQATSDEVRKSLIDSSSFRKYLVYAVGEILLVMIGILLALQVNNWNQERKEIKEERIVLQTISNTLQSNIEFFDYFNEALNYFDRSGQLIDSLLREKSLTSDTLYRHFHLSVLNGWNDLRISEIGYNFIEQTNGKIIKNVELRNEIIQLFENNYSFALQQIEWGKYDNPETKQFIDEYFERTPYLALKPYDATELNGNRMYNSLLKKARAQRIYFIGIIEGQKVETKRVLQLIKDELGED
jgi:hypothetical protein